MAKYHVNGAGEAGLCKATQGGCPFGDEEKHYSTPEEARAAYETTATKKKGLFSIFRNKREPNPVAAKDRRSVDGMLDMRRFDGLLAVAKREKWDVAPDGTRLNIADVKQNTFEALSQLQREDREGGTAFERAARLKVAYEKLREANSVEAPSYNPDTLSPDIYVRMAAPATHDAVYAVEDELTKHNLQGRPSNLSTENVVLAINETLKADATDPQSVANAIDVLRDNGWRITKNDSAKLARAIQKGQEQAATYGNRFKYEQDNLF